MASETNVESSIPPLAFVIGPLRTGSSLMSRCLDDHPSMICLCESEINRALFGDLAVEHHSNRMAAHGLSLNNVIRLLDRKRQGDVKSLFDWYGQVFPMLRHRLEKPGATLLGDKSPDYSRCPEIVEAFARQHRLIYTVRDPRAIFASIEVQDDATPQAKAERWEFLIQNYAAWKPHLDSPNVLVVRYEDLVTSPIPTMSGVYRHLCLPESTRFLEPFRRVHPGRFLWPTAVDFATGISRDFDPSRLSSWKSKLDAGQLDRIQKEPIIAEFMDRFGYE
ncbi:MAG: hypothetical protein ABS79_02215 [Planctomycetes bacterium SCN 63-9]|nr:MAG: hypothetical protein ABS79_02215 [Planctomycetes bacterium SCN 63-9]